MDVGIDYRDLLVSGRLPALARALGVSEETALGRFTISCFETQDKELILVTAKTYADAVGLRIEDPQLMLTAMVRAKLASPVETQEAGLGETQTWLLHGNDKHVAKLRAFRANARSGGLAKAAKRQAPGKQAAAKRQANGTTPASAWQQNDTENVPPAYQARALETGILEEEDLRAPAPDLSPAISTEIDPRSSLPSKSEKALALSAPPSAAADALSVLDVKPPKRKERSPEQKRRSVANARLYCELYERAEGHAPTGLDQSFYGAMAKFSDKHAEGAEQILRWVFEHCPDKGFRAKGWPLPLIIEQAPRLWRELNNPRAAIENIAAPRQQHQLAVAASNDLAFEEYQRRKAERLANANQV